MWSPSSWHTVASEQICSGSWVRLESLQCPGGLPDCEACAWDDVSPCDQEVCVKTHQRMLSCSPGFIPSAVLMKFVMLFSFFWFIIHTVRKNSKAKVKVSLPDDFCLISYAGVHGDTATLSCLGTFVVQDRGGKQGAVRCSDMTVAGGHCLNGGWLLLC